MTFRKIDTDVVKFETALRLEKHEFPKQDLEAGQIYYHRETGLPYLIAEPEDTVLLPYMKLLREEVNDNYVYAPTSLVIQKELNKL